jgi:MFS family permease
MGPLGGYLTDRYGARPFTLVGSGLLLVGLITLTLVAQRPTSVFDLAWRLLLTGMGMGLFNGPNQTLLMSVGSRETMGAASALSNLAGRIGSVCGPLVIGITWSFLASLSTQMVIGMLVLDGIAMLNLLFAWSSALSKSRGFSAGDESGQTHRDRAYHARLHSHRHREIGR